MTKLLACGSCGDAFVPRREDEVLRRCRCGRVTGWWESYSFLAPLDRLEPAEVTPHA